MITSMLDTDFYKLTMMQAVFHHYAGAWASYEFKWRNWKKMQLNIDPKKFAILVREQIENLCNLRFEKDELDYLATIPFFKPDFIEYLRLFQLNKDYITAVGTYNLKDDELLIKVEGPWLNTILYEVPILAVVSELYTRHTGLVYYTVHKNGSTQLKDKIKWLDTHLHRDEPFTFADLYGIKPIGTMAHEFIQAHQQLGSRLVDSQAFALQTWADEYRGELGIALSDCLGFDMFVKDFDRYFALLFDGCRHDSGDPVWWCEKLIQHYRDLRIDPHTKMAVFSDGLSFPIAVELFKQFHAVP